MYFRDTGIKALDEFLYALNEASNYANDSTRWSTLEWDHHNLLGTTPENSVQHQLNLLVQELTKHNKLINKLRKAGFIDD